MVWQYIVYFVIALVAVYVMQPKAQTRPPAGFDEIQVPTAEEGREIPVVFGTKVVKSPNVVWYGDYLTRAIRVKSGKK